MQYERLKPYTPGLGCGCELCRQPPARLVEAQTPEEARVLREKYEASRRSKLNDPAL